MENQNFSVALIDNAGNMFKKTELGQIVKIANVLEHESRLDEFSQESQFFIDETMYMALGCQGVPFKYTKVFVNDVSQFTNQKYCKFFPIDEFGDNVRKYNSFDAHKPLFFLGGTEFLKLSMRFSSRLLLTVVDANYESNFEVFPQEDASSIFKGRRTVQPVLLAEIKKYQRALKQKREQSFIITAGGSKVMTEPSAPKYTEEVMNTPNYMFYEFYR